MQTGRVWLTLAISLSGGLACEPGTLGSGEPAAPSRHDMISPPPPRRVTSCGDGRIAATGSVDEGLFVATAINLLGVVCPTQTMAWFYVAGNGAVSSAISFALPADYLDGGGLRLPLGERSVSAGISGRPGTATVAITTTEDVFMAPDVSGAHIEGSFEVLDGGHRIAGAFSCPFCTVGPCLPTLE